MSDERVAVRAGRRLDGLPDLLTRSELASFTGISVATFARWAMTGEGPAMTKLGRAARYRKAAVLAWLDRGEAEAASVQWGSPGRGR